MILAGFKDKKIIVDIITATFEDNPSANDVIGVKGNRKKKIGNLASYAFLKGLNRNGVFLSDNKMGLAICYHSAHGSLSLKEILYELRFAISIPIKNLFFSIKREAYLKKHRYQGEHLYFWFFGVRKGGGRAGFEIKDNLFKSSEKEQLPIILETSVERNKKIYERYGFSVYHEWSNSGKDYTLWFMIRKVK